MTMLRLLSAVVCTGLAISAAAFEPPSFFARYEVQHSGAKIAETTLSIALDPQSGDYVMRSIAEPRGLAALIRYGDVLEVSHFRATDTALVPLHYRFDDGTRKGRRNSTLKFDWDNNVALSFYKDSDVILPLAGTETDRLLVQLAVMRDLQREQLAPAYRVIDRNAVKVYQYSVIGEEVLITPAGNFDTVRVRRQRPDSSRATLIWAAREHSYLPVKMVQLKDERPNVVLTLTSLNYLAGTPPQPR